MPIPDCVQSLVQAAHNCLVAMKGGQAPDVLTRLYLVRSVVGARAKFEEVPEDEIEEFIQSAAETYFSPEDWSEVQGIMAKLLSLH